MPLPLPTRPETSVLRRRRRQGGFSLIELLVVVAVLGIITAIAVPNLKNALRKSRRTTAYKSMKVLEAGILTYMLDNDTPPLTMSSTTLEPMVSRGYIPRQTRPSILNSLERNQLIWYYGWEGDGNWWDYDYGIAFRPKKDPSNVTCYLWPEGMWRLEGGTWTELM